MQVVVFDDEVVPTHLHAHARAIVNVAMPHGLVHATHPDTARVFIEHTHVMDVAVLDAVSWTRKRLAISATEADSIAASVADLAA